MIEVILFDLGGVIVELGGLPEMREWTGNRYSDEKFWEMWLNSSAVRFKSECPVEKVSWHDVQKFIKRLNAKEKGRSYRLPTEAEWEFAAWAESRTAFSNGDITVT